MMSRNLSSKFLALVVLLIAFVELTVCQRPVGIHLDVEPAALAGGAEGNAADFIALLRKVKEVTNGKTKLAADVPMGMGPAPLGAWKYQSRPISEHVTDIVDTVSLMAYRDKAAPSDGILDHSRDFLDYAKKAGKKVTVGVEVTCEGLPNKVTFCEEGDAHTETQLTTVANTLSAEYGKTFGGIVVHHYNSYNTKPFASSSVSRTAANRAMWVWDHKVVLDNTARNTFLEFARTRKVNTVYMDSLGLVDRTDNRPKLTSFINACYNAGIQVELLFGGNDWVYAKNHASLVSLVQSAVSYITNFPTTARRDIEIVETPSNTTKTL